MIHSQEKGKIDFLDPLNFWKITFQSRTALSRG